MLLMETDIYGERALPLYQTYNSVERLCRLTPTTPSFLRFIFPAQLLEFIAQIKGLLFLQDLFNGQVVWISTARLETQFGFFEKDIEGLKSLVSASIRQRRTPPATKTDLCIMIRLQKTGDKHLWRFVGRHD